MDFLLECGGDFASAVDSQESLEDYWVGVVALTGIEPVLFALRGRRVNQLHHSAKVFNGNSLDF